METGKKVREKTFMGVQDEGRDNTEKIGRNRFGGND